MNWKEKAAELSEEKKNRLKKIHRRMQRRLAEDKRNRGMSKGLLPDPKSNVHRVSSNVIRRRPIK